MRKRSFGPRAVGFGIFNMLAAAAVTAAVQGACTSEFKGISKGTTKQSDSGVPPGLSPDESDKGQSPEITPTPQPTVPPICSGTHKAARLYYIVDNSNSHGYVVPGEALRQGTDPARVTQSVRGKNEKKTYRQEALYTMVKRAAELDKKAKQDAPDFPGTQLGIAYFPKYQGDGNPQNRYAQEFSDLAQYVNVTGPGGTGESIFPNRLTDVSTFEETEAADQALWDSLNFTHTPGGSTPYATGLRAGVENFEPMTRNDNDPRENIVLFVTDGLPTDESPSIVRNLRTQLGNKTKVILISVYDPNEDPTVVNSPLYSNLKTAFLGPTNWATKPNNPDFFEKSEAGFQNYWKNLVTLPSQISEQVIKIAQASQLQAEMDKILQFATTCTDGALKP